MSVIVGKRCWLIEGQSQGQEQDRVLVMDEWV